MGCKSTYTKKYDRIIRTGRSESDTSFNKGFALYILDKFTESIPEFEKVVSLDTKDSEALFYLGMGYAKTGNSEKATEYFEKSLAIAQPKTSHYNLSFLYFVMGRYQEALTECNLALKKNEPHVVNIYMNMASIFSNVGMYEQSINAYNMALQADKKVAALYNVYYFIALSYEKLGNNKKAIEALSLAVSVSPNFAHGHYALGVLFLKEQNEKSARDQYNILKLLDNTLADELQKYIDQFVSSPPQ